MEWRDIDIGETVKVSLDAKRKLENGEPMSTEEQISAGLGFGISAILDKAAPALPHLETALHMLRQARQE